MASPGPKRCLGCGYILEGLPENRCPECGQPFDPASPPTYSVRPVDGDQLLRFALAALLGSAFVIAGEFVLEMEWSVAIPPRAISLTFLSCAAVNIAAAWAAIHALGVPRPLVRRRGLVFVAATIGIIGSAGFLFLLVYTALLMWSELVR